MTGLLAEWYERCELEAKKTVANDSCEYLFAAVNIKKYSQANVGMANQINGTELLNFWRAKIPCNKQLTNPFNISCFRIFLRTWCVEEKSWMTGWKMSSTCGVLMQAFLHSNSSVTSWWRSAVQAPHRYIRTVAFQDRFEHVPWPFRHPTSTSVLLHFKTDLNTCHDHSGVTDR